MDLREIMMKHEAFEEARRMIEKDYSEETCEKLLFDLEAMEGFSEVVDGDYDLNEWVSELAEKMADNFYDGGDIAEVWERDRWILDRVQLDLSFIDLENCNVSDVMYHAFKHDLEERLSDLRSIDLDELRELVAEAEAQAELEAKASKQQRNNRSRRKP